MRALTLDELAAESGAPLDLVIWPGPATAAILAARLTVWPKTSTTQQAAPS